MPALNGVEAKLKAGAKVGDVGCSHGSSTIPLAQAFPKSTFHGFDFHGPSIDHARQRARDDHRRLLDAEPHGDHIGGLEDDTADVASEAIRVSPRHHFSEEQQAKGVASPRNHLPCAGFELGQHRTPGTVSKSLVVAVAEPHLRAAPGLAWEPKKADRFYTARNCSLISSGTNKSVLHR
jgi:hypothetical protein